MAPKGQSDSDYEQPRLTGVDKLKLPFVDQLIQQSLVTNTFNNLDRKVDPKFGDVYIYRHGAAQYLPFTTSRGTLTYSQELHLTTEQR